MCTKSAQDGKPVRFVKSYLPYLLAQAAERTSLPFHKILKNMGIKESEWRVLGTLYDAADGMGVTQLSRHVLVPQPTLSRRLDHMENRGLVTRVTGNTDRRKVALTLTSEGRETAEKLIAAALAREDVDTAGLNSEELQELKRLLVNLVAGRNC